jgi:formylmethanofuran dehydrogenase subunit B
LYVTQSTRGFARMGASGRHEGIAIVERVRSLRYSLVMNVEIRVARESDAEAVLALRLVLDGESELVLLERTSRPASNTSCTTAMGSPAAPRHPRDHDTNPDGVDDVCG